MLNSLIGIIASSGGVTSTNSYESIATVTVGSGGSSSITFSSIPSTYQHLQVRGIARGSAGGSDRDALNIMFNSDNASNYLGHFLTGTGATVSAAAITGTNGSNNQIGGSSSYADGGTASSIFGAGVIDILDYTNSNKYKTVRTLSGQDQNGGNGRIVFNSGLWQSTSAINSIVLTMSSNFAQYSSFALYGIKG